MTRVVVGLAGKSGSGKSTVAAALQMRFGFARVSFGDRVRYVAHQRTLPSDRGSLDVLGRALIDELGWDQFCESVLAGTELAARVVVDGIRHVAAQTTIRKLVAPARFGMAFVEIDEAVRLRHLSLRGRSGDTGSVFEMNDDMEQLRREAEIIVDGASSTAADVIEAWVKSLSANDH